MLLENDIIKNVGLPQSICTCKMVTNANIKVRQVAGIASCKCLKLCYYYNL